MIALIVQASLWFLIDFIKTDLVAETEQLDILADYNGKIYIRTSQNTTLSLFI